MSVWPATQVRPLRSEGVPRQTWEAELRLDRFRPRSKRCRRTDMKETFFSIGTKRYGRRDRSGPSGGGQAKPRCLDRALSCCVQVANRMKMPDEFT